MTEIYVMFGNASHVNSYARGKAVNPRKIVLATQPEQIQGLMKQVVTIKVIRMPEEVWKPTTFPCEKRVAETERMIKEYKRLGTKIEDVEW